jgi:hypothetical protein
MASSINASTSGAGGVITTADNTGILNLQTASTTAVTIDASQNVGIGTTSPASKLNLQGSSLDYVTFSTSGTNKAYVGVDNGTPELVVGATAGDLVIRSNQSTLFGLSGGGFAAKIDTSGNVLVGTTSNFASGNVQGIAAQASGNASLALNRTTDTGAVARFYQAGTNVGRIEVTGSATTYVTSSDYRLKENVQPMVDALDKVAQLKPVTYTWKSDGSDGQGFIAHELQAVVPECVTGQKDAVNEDGSIDPQGIDTSFLVATLTAAIQEQQTIINDIKARVIALEAK